MIAKRRSVLRLLVLWAGLAAPVSAQQPDRARIDELAEAQIAPALENFREYLSIPNDAHFPWPGQ